MAYKKSISAEVTFCLLKAQLFLQKMSISLPFS